MYNNKEIAVGTKVFKRTEKLADLLDSIPPFVDKVYIADDGETKQRNHLYEQAFEFDFELIDLEFDAGLGHGRKEITDRLKEDYLLIVDTDHLVPDSITKLVDALETHENLGGVSGQIKEGAEIGGLFQHLSIDHNILMRTVKTPREYKVDGVSCLGFDFIPNAALFRAECLDSYTWDANYKIGYEHIDFYLGHLNTEWNFVMHPEVIFPHFPGGDSEYSSFRSNPTNVLKSKHYFLDKWGFRQAVSVDSYLDQPHAAGLQKYEPTWSPRLAAFLEDLNEKIWLWKWKLYSSVLKTSS